MRARTWPVLGWVLVALVALGRPARAHLMVAQHGTLNLVGDGGFLVLSLPAAAFPAVDDDGDGRVSMAEARRHEPALLAAVQAGVSLRDADGPRPLEGLMLSLSPADDAPGAPAADLVALGRFRLASAAPSSSLRLGVRLFGAAPATRALQVTITRGSAQQLVVLTPDAPEAAVLPPDGRPFVDALRLGIGHILGGLDHLLFLLVVLAAGGSWRWLLATLTCFTLGHAATLALAVLGGLRAPAALVEPAIAVTIVGMAALDGRAAARGRPLRPAWRLGLVFGCALIHGLGLASSLTTLGIDRGHLLPLVAGFNLGVEAGQVAACAAVLGAVAGLRRLVGAAALAWSLRLARAAAIAAGAAWFIERVLA